MTPKEKATELIRLYYCKIIDTTKFKKSVTLTEAKEFALITVNQIIDFMKLEDDDSGTCHNANSKWMDFWLNVKHEIERS